MSSTCTQSQLCTATPILSFGQCEVSFRLLPSLVAPHLFLFEICSYTHTHTHTNTHTHTHTHRHTDIYIYIYIYIYILYIYILTDIFIYQGRIQAVFEIGNRFWADKNWCPNFDRSTKGIILILFNTR